MSIAPYNPIEKPPPRVKKPRTRIRHQSKRHAAEQRVWANITREAIALAHGQCCCGLMCCTGKAVEGHHRQPRSQGGRNELSNCVPLCWHGHRWIHENPQQAVKRGLLIMRKEVSTPTD